MTTIKYIVVGLIEPTVITSAWLSSTGVNTEEEDAILGQFVDSFNKEVNALQCIEGLLEDGEGLPEYCYSLIKQYNNE